MDRRDFYFKQPVSESELNGAFDAVEFALWHLVTDLSFTGIATGMVGAQVSPTPTMAVTISGPGYAYDSSGERIFVPAPFQPQPNGLDLTVDSNSVPTAVSTGNERWLAVYAKFLRALSDPRVDGSSMSIFFQANESYQFVIVQGGEAAVGTATRPTLDPSQGVLLFDVHRTASQTQILNSDIDTTRRQDTFAISQSPISIDAGTLRGSLIAILQALNNHINGIAGEHPDTAISSPARSGSPVSLSSGSVGTQLAALLAYLDGGLQTSLSSLATSISSLTDSEIASPARSGSPLALSLGTVGAQLDAIRAYIDGSLATAIAGILASIATLQPTLGHAYRFASTTNTVGSVGFATVASGSVVVAAGQSVLVNANVLLSWTTGSPGDVATPQVQITLTGTAGLSTVFRISQNSGTNLEAPYSTDMLFTAADGVAPGTLTVTLQVKVDITMSSTGLANALIVETVPA